MRRRTKGAGSLRLRGRTWWITYYVGGHPIAESSGSTDREKAANLLKQRIGEIAAGRDVSPDRATINDLCALVIADYRVRKLRDAAIVKWRYEANIKPAVGNLPAARSGASQVRAFVSARREAGASDPTVNRELSIIRRGFRLGFEEDPPMVRRVPHILKLDEDNARQGFLTPAQYETLLATLPERLKALFAVAYHVGTRKGDSARSNGLRWTLTPSAFGCKRPRPKAKRRANCRSMEKWSTGSGGSANDARRVASGYFSITPGPLALNCVVGAKPAKPLASRHFSFTISAGRQYETCAWPGSTRVCG